MYFKGALFLHTLRSVVNDDAKWWRVIRDFYQRFKYQNIMTEDMVRFFNTELKQDLTPMFDQYLQRLERAFGGAVLAMPALYDPNVIVFALKGLPRELPWRTLYEDAARLEARLGIPFTRYLPRLRGMNRCTRDTLLLGNA